MTKRPSRSLSVGAHRERRELLNFCLNQKAFLDVHYFIVDHYMRIKFAYLALDEIWLYLLQRSYPQVLPDQANLASQPLFEQLHKQLFSSIMAEHNIATFKLQCSHNNPDMHQQYASIEAELQIGSTNFDVF